MPAGPALGGLDFLEPVMIGQTLSLTIDVLSARRARSLRVAGHAGRGPVLAALVFVAEDGDRSAGDGTRCRPCHGQPLPAAHVPVQHRGSISEILDVALASPSRRPETTTTVTCAAVGPAARRRSDACRRRRAGRPRAYLVVRSIESIDGRAQSPRPFTSPAEYTKWTLLDVRLRWTTTCTAPAA